MKADRAGKVEYGTFLEFRMRGSAEVQSQEFWGVGHAERAMDYLRSSNLLERTQNHKFGPLQKDVV